MDKEKSFYPERKEIESKSYAVDFDGAHFGNTEKQIDTLRLVGELTEWWQKICVENGIDPKDKRIRQTDYYLIELAKNALEYAEGGEIKVIFEPNKITVAVSDQGQGFEDIDHITYVVSLGHGLSEVKKYADEFVAETNGKKYAKVKGKRKLADLGASDVSRGLKITFIKNF